MIVWLVECIPPQLIYDYFKSKAWFMVHLVPILLHFRYTYRIFAESRQEYQYGLGFGSAFYIFLFGVSAQDTTAI
jgi:hypothetical protein